MLKTVFSACFIATSLAIGVSGCKKSEPEPLAPDESGYLIVNNKGGGFPIGNISVYKKAKGELVSPFYQLNVKTTAASISDAVVSGEKLYVARAEYRGVEIVNATNFQVLNSVTYGKGAPVDAFKHLAVSPDKIFVSDRDYIPNSPNHSNLSYLKAISLTDVNRVDSIPVIQDAAIWAVAYANGKIFVSAGNAQWAILVFDATTYAKLGQVNLTSFCSTLLVDNDNNVLALGSKLILINSNNLSVIKERSIFGTDTNIGAGDYSTCSSGFSLDRETNMIYHVGAAAQPASAPFILKSYNIVTDVSTLLSNNFISASTVAFDQKDKMILIGSAAGSGGVVTMYSTKGVVTKSVSIPNPPDKIIVVP
jgi:hypothetical protein